MKYPNLRSATAAILTLSVLIISACSPPYINRQNFGPPATVGDINDYFSGSYFGGKSGGTFYGSDGKVRGLNGDTLYMGTWKADKNGLGSTFLFEDLVFYRANNGRTISRSSSTAEVVYIQPDGTVILDRMGGGNSGTGKPGRQFLSEEKFNALLKELLPNTSE